MASESDQSENAASAMSEEEASASESVRRYLLDHPEFFDQNTDLLRALTPVQQFPDSEVIDLQQFVVGRLRNDVSKLQTAQGQIIDASRANLRAQSEVHEAVLAILAADSFERMINTITSDLADLLRLDVVSLCVEAANNDPLGRVGKSAVYVLPVGAVDRIMDEHAFMLRNQAPPDDAVFGPATGLVQSFALARMEISPKAPIGILALGAREAEKFQAGQGTELLGFLVRVVEQQFRAWLHLPA